MKSYFTYMLNVGADYQREWYVEEFNVSNPLFGIHKRFNQVFESKEECIDAIYQQKIPREGGNFNPAPKHLARYERYERFKAGKY